MKTYHETHIRKAEIAQLILLHQLYARQASRDLFFQGGTALRWCYGGSRFSEDLDFVTPLEAGAVQRMIQAAVKGAEKLMIPHFGVGEVTLNERRARADAMKWLVSFQPARSRGKFSVKLEVERLADKRRPDTQNHVLSLLSPVVYLIAAGEFLVPRPHTVLVVQTPAEILSDKIRALLERTYLKGRDLFDLWYLYSVLKTPVETNTIERKFSLYRAAFVARRSGRFFISPSPSEREAMRQAICQDLARFLPPEVLAVHQAEKFETFLDAARSLFAALKAGGVRLP